MEKTIREVYQEILELDKDDLEYGYIELFDDCIEDDSSDYNHLVMLAEDGSLVVYNRYDLDDDTYTGVFKVGLKNIKSLSQKEFISLIHSGFYYNTCLEI